MSVYGVQRRRLKKAGDLPLDYLPGPVSKELALVMTILTVACVATAVTMFWLGTLVTYRIGGVLLIPTALLIVTDAFLWSRLFDAAHPARHPMRFARARWQARTNVRPPAGARTLRMRSRRQA